VKLARSFMNGLMPPRESSDSNVKALQRILARKSAAMLCDAYTDRLQDDLGSVTDRLSERMLAASSDNLCA